MTDASFYRKVKAETATLLGFKGVDGLSAADRTKLNHVCALRIAADRMEGALYRGENVDVDELMRVNAAIWQFVPTAAPTAHPPNIIDPLKTLYDAVCRIKGARLIEAKRRGDARDRELEALRARVEELEALVFGGPPEPAQKLLPAPNGGGAPGATPV